MNNLAKKLLENLDRPFLYVEEVTDITGLSGAHIRMMVKRGSLKIPDTPPAERGHGKRGLYPFSDLIEILTVAELSRIGVNPIIKNGPRQWKSFANPVSNGVLLFLNSYSNGTVVQEKYRFVVIYYDDDVECLEGDFMADPFAQIQTSHESTRVVIDCQSLANRLLNVFDKYKGGLVR